MHLLRQPATMVQPISSSSTQTPPGDEPKPARMKIRLRRWKPKKSTPKDDTGKIPNLNEEVTAKTPTRKNTNNSDAEDRSPLRLISPRATDATPATSSSRRKHFWSLRKTPVSPSPLSKPSALDGVKEQPQTASPTPAPRKEMTPAEIRQAMSVPILVPRQKSELEINALLAQSPGKKAALGSHPPSRHVEDVSEGPPKEGGKRRGDRSTELLG
ncbi:unnamed protein product [Periconia digitata]|uniref:Uncharacterized protein n=1 Tax=Periconia digitata TaxID=1303443 RepID=A0A9W4UQX1_9PLEO|nr:unnamed protein product [Periconia digitata]